MASERSAGESFPHRDTAERRCISRGVNARLGCGGKISQVISSGQMAARGSHRNKLAIRATRDKHARDKPRTPLGRPG
jgi:hypothetical protein